MGYNDLHACLRTVMRRADIVDFYHRDAQMKYLCVLLDSVAREMEDALVRGNGFTLAAAFDVIERVLTASLPTRGKLAEAQRAHDRLVRQLERQQPMRGEDVAARDWLGTYPRAQEGAT